MGVVAIIRDTFRQAVSQVVWFVLFGFGILMPLMVMFSISTDPSGNMYLFGELIGDVGNPELVAATIRVEMVGILYGLYAILFIFTASFLATRNMRKGVAEIYLSKPISRGEILLGKFIGTFLVFYIPAIIMIFLTYTVVNSKLGVSGVSCLPMMGFAALAGILLTSLCMGFAYMSNGPVLGLLLLTALWVISPITINALAFFGEEPVVDYGDNIHGGIFRFDGEDSFILKATKFFRRYIILPLSDIGNISKGNEIPNAKITTTRPLYVALAQTVLGLGVAYVCFIRRDY